MSANHTNSFFPSPLHPHRSRCSYLIDAGSADWAVAESQIANVGHGASTVVSVKSLAGKKRKFHEGLANGGDEERQRIKGEKKTRRSMKKAKR